MPPLARQTQVLLPPLLLLLLLLPQADACAARLPQVVKDSPQPHDPLLFGFTNTNSDLARGVAKEV
jgi:hypothetical protein